VFPVINRTILGETD